MPRPLVDADTSGSDMPLKPGWCWFKASAPVAARADTLRERGSSVDARLARTERQRETRLRHTKASPALSSMVSASNPTSPADFVAQGLSASGRVARLLEALGPQTFTNKSTDTHTHTLTHT